MEASTRDILTIGIPLIAILAGILLNRQDVYKLGERLDARINRLEDKLDAGFERFDVKMNAGFERLHNDLRARRPNKIVGHRG